MEPKKNPRIDLQKKSPLFIQIGLLVALSFVLFSFELKQYTKPMSLLPDRDASTYLDETILQTHREQPTPPPARMPNILTTIDIVPNDKDIIDIKWFIPEPDQHTIIPPFVPNLGRERDSVDPYVIVPIPEVNARFKGGDEALFAWLGKNLVYPEIAIGARIQGIVYVEFVVEVDGSITDISIKQGNLGGGCEEAAIAAVSRMPKWEPAKQRNRYVRSRFVLPVQFVLY